MPGFELEIFEKPLLSIYVNICEWFVKMILIKKFKSFVRLFFKDYHLNINKYTNIIFHDYDTIRS